MTTFRRVTQNKGYCDNCDNFARLSRGFAAGGVETHQCPVCCGAASPMSTAYAELLTCGNGARGVHTSHFKRRVWSKAVRRGHVVIISAWNDGGNVVRTTNAGRKILREVDALTRY